MCLQRAFPRLEEPWRDQRTSVCSVSFLLPRAGNHLCSFLIRISFCRMLHLTCLAVDSKDRRTVTLGRQVDSNSVSKSMTDQSGRCVGFYVRIDQKVTFFIRYESVVCTRACICTLTPICVGRSEDNLGESVVSSLMWVSEMKPVTKVVRLGESVLTHRGITLTVHFSLFLQFQTDHTVSLIVF